MATPLIPITLAWLIGIWFTSRIALPTLVLGAATIVAFVGIVVTWRMPKPRWVFVLAFAAILGMLRYNLAQPHFDQTSLGTYNDQQKSVIVEGIIAGEPDVRAPISRLSAHLVVIGLAVLAVALSGVRVPGRVRPSALPPHTPAPAAAWGNRTAYEVLTARGGPRFTGDDSQIVRLAVPLTPNINRPRKDVISYTVQPGDSLFGIAQEFNLQPESVLWANPELKDNPDLLSVGTEIAIPPVDGVLHTVQKGDTLDSIARKYKVTPEAITTATWNHLLPGQELPIGQTLIVPGGKREAVVWQLPVTTQASRSRGAGGWTNAGQCAGVTVKPLGTGQFIWPSNAHWISGNPYTWWHQGIDLAGNLGDPVYSIYGFVVQRT